MIGRRLEEPGQENWGVTERWKVRISRVSRQIIVFFDWEVCIPSWWRYLWHSGEVSLRTEWLKQRSFLFPWRMFHVFCNWEGSLFLSLFSFLLWRIWDITSLTLPKPTRVFLSHMACISASSGQSIFMANKFREISVPVPRASVRGQDGFWKCYVAQHHIFAEGDRFSHEVPHCQRRDYWPCHLAGHHIISMYWIEAVCLVPF